MEISAAQALQSLLKDIRMEQHFWVDCSPLKQAMRGVKTLGITDKLSSVIPQEKSFEAILNPPDLLPAKPIFKHKISNDFVNFIKPYALEAAHLLGLDPKILIAQAALETGWGKHVIKDAQGNSSNNFFNIKAKAQEDKVEVVTTEYINQVAKKETAYFKKYDSPAQSFNDYVLFLKENHRYATARIHAANPERFVWALQEAGYATDPSYAMKIMNIFKGL